MVYTYYANAPEFEDKTIIEIKRMESVGTFEYKCPVFKNGEHTGDYAVVDVIAPKGYELTDHDFSRIDELVNEN